MILKPRSWDISVYISQTKNSYSNLGAGNVYFDNLVIITNEGPVMKKIIITRLGC